jgi:peptide/nickel transport system substrate-binding protein
LNRVVFQFLIILLVGAVSLTACRQGTPAPTATTIETLLAGEVPTTQVERTETRPPPGSTLFWSIASEPDTLDIQKSAVNASWNIMWQLGGSLVTIRDGEISPYLAESWLVSEEGLSIEFNLKQGVTFHNGSPLTAADWVYTFTRATHPDTASPTAGPSLGSLITAQALDDYTLRLTWSVPNAGIFAALADRSYLQPLPQNVVESMDAEFGRSPVGVGPYMFEDWVTGDYVSVVRNPDYDWGPSSDDGSGPYKIERIFFRIIPDYAARLAGFESGEIDIAAFEPQDADTISSLNMSRIVEFPAAGFGPYIAFNLTKPPWNDLNVRKAIYMAFDRQAMLDQVLDGKGVPQFGPLSPSVMGYDPAVEELGHGFDVGQAKMLLDEAGYTEGAGGIREKDGQRLSFTLYYFAGDDTVVRTAGVVQQSLEDIGIALELSQMETGTLFAMMLTGDFDILISGIGWNEADILYRTLHSSQIGVLNYHFTDDPDLDALLDQQRTTFDLAERQQMLNQLQEYILQQVYYVPLFAANDYFAVNERIDGASFNANYAQFDLSAASIVEE